MPPKFGISDILAGPLGEQFLRGFVHRSFAKGSLVCSGDPEENGILVVASGRLRMYLVGEDRELSLFYFGPGDMFCRHSGCLIETTEPSELYLTDIVTFDRKLRENPQIALALISILGRALASFVGTIEDLMFHDIKKRIARFFVDHAKTDGRPKADGVDLSLRLTVEEIAKSIGSSRQATSTAMNGLIRAGYLFRTSRASYSIPSLAKLATLA